MGVRRYTPCSYTLSPPYRLLGERRLTPIGESSVLRRVPRVVLKRRLLYLRINSVTFLFYYLEKTIICPSSGEGEVGEEESHRGTFFY